MLTRSTSSNLRSMQVPARHDRLIRVLMTTESEGVTARTANSIPIAPTNHPSDWSGLSKNARGQKGADKPDDPVRA